jgi:hypothetical protein
MAADLIQRMEFYSSIVRHGAFGAGALAVAFALLYRFYNNNTGRCDPGRATLAREAGVSSRHVKRATDELQAGGWFDVKPGAGAMTRHGRTTAYTPLFSRTAHLPTRACSPTPIAAIDRRGGESVRGDEFVTGDKSGQEGVTSSAPRTSKEPEGQSRREAARPLGSARTAPSDKEPARLSATGAEPAPTTAQVFTLTPIDGGKAKRAATSPTREEHLYLAKHGCTIDSYEPASSMAEWAAEKAPLIKDPIAPDTVEEIKDIWRKKGEQPKDFDATYRNYLRVRQRWAEKEREPTGNTSAADKPRKPLLAGSLEARRAYDE